jgi:hypothetical protein
MAQRVSLGTAGDASVGFESFAGQTEAALGRRGPVTPIDVLVSAAARRCGRWVRAVPASLPWVRLCSGCFAETGRQCIEFAANGDVGRCAWAEKSEQAQIGFSSYVGDTPFAHLAVSGH